MFGLLLVIGVILIITRQATPLMKGFALILGLLLAGAFVAALIGLVAGAVGSLLLDRLWASVIGMLLGITIMLGLLWLLYGSRAMTTDVIASAMAIGAGIGCVASSVSAKRARPWKTPTGGGT